MEFLDSAILKRVRGQDEWVLQEQFRVILKDKRQVRIPPGFVTDKASVPRAVWWLIPRDDKYIIDAALTHDYLYLMQQIQGQWITRLEADLIFKDILEYAGMGFIRKRMAYRAVRMGGWLFFDKRAKRIRNRHYL